MGHSLLSLLEVLSLYIYIFCYLHILPLSLSLSLSFSLPLSLSLHPPPLFHLFSFYKFRIRYPINLSILFCFPLFVSNIIMTKNYTTLYKKKLTEPQSRV